MAFNFDQEALRLAEEAVDDYLDGFEDTWSRPDGEHVAKLVLETYFRHQASNDRPLVFDGDSIQPAQWTAVAVNVAGEQIYGRFLRIRQGGAE